MANYLVIGAGLQGEAIASHLLRHDDTEKVGVLDYFANKAMDIRDKLCNSKAKALWANAEDYHQMQAAMKDFDVAIGAASYKYNYELSKTAINMGVHFCDLGGNNSIVEKQFSLDERARENNVKILPDQGVAPGAVSIIAANGYEEMAKRGLVPDYIHLRVGGLDQFPKGALKYGIVFSASGLINEYKEPTEILRGKKVELVDSLTGLEQLEFQGFGMMEAAYTSGGSSTLTKSLEGVVDDVDYKTIRYPGHFRFMRMLSENGFFEDKELNKEVVPEQISYENIPESIIKEHEKALKELRFLSNNKVRLKKATLRGLTEQLLESNLPKVEKDMILLKVTVGDKKGTKVEYELVDKHDEVHGHSAMQRTTGYSAAIVARMMANNVIKDNGVLYSEKSVPSDIFLDEWEKAGINLVKRVEE